MAKPPCLIACMIGCLGSGVLFAQTEISEPNPSGKTHAVNPKTPEGLRQLLTYTGKPLNLVIGHRGGARKHYPENCIATFEHTLKHTAAMMEVDPRYTRDNAIVLHHDDTLDRTTNGKGKVSDFTLQELKQLRLKDAEGNLTDHVMPTLDEALEWARGKTVLILDRKGISMEDRARKVSEHHAEAYTLLMAYTFEDAKACYKLNPNIMMEVFIHTQAQFDAFEKTGVPWSNVVVFVGHSSPTDRNLYRMIHAKGALCIEGTSRNLDRRMIEANDANRNSIHKAYHNLMSQGADLIETDLPIAVGQLLTTQSR